MSSSPVRLLEVILKIFFRDYYQIVAHLVGQLVFVYLPSPVFISLSVYLHLLFLAISLFVCKCLSDPGRLQPTIFRADSNNNCDKIFSRLENWASGVYWWRQSARILWRHLQRSWWRSIVQIKGRFQKFPILKPARVPICRV